MNQEGVKWRPWTKVLRIEKMQLDDIISKYGTSMLMK